MIRVLTLAKPGDFKEIFSKDPADWSFDELCNRYTYEVNHEREKEQQIIEQNVVREEQIEI